MKKAVGVRRLKASERNERSECSDGFESHPPHLLTDPMRMRRFENMQDKLKKQLS